MGGGRENKNKGVHKTFFLTPTKALEILPKACSSWMSYVMVMSKYGQQVGLCGSGAGNTT